MQILHGNICFYWPDIVGFLPCLLLLHVTDLICPWFPAVAASSAVLALRSVTRELFPPLCRTGWRLDYYVRGAVGCVTFCWSRSFHEPCNVLNERRGWGDTSQPVCITVQLVLLVRRGCTCWPHHAVFSITHETTSSWSTVAPFTLLEKHRRGVGYLQDLYWSWFTSWGDLEQMIRSSVGQWSRSVILIWKTLPWKELRRWLGSFAGSDQINQILVLLIWL